MIVRAALASRARGLGRDLAARDGAVFRRTAEFSSPALDAVLPRLTGAADHSVLWLGIAGALSATGGARLGRAARRGVVCIGISSLLVNQVVKRTTLRRRPPLAVVPLARRAHRIPTSSAFPSGHASSAAAFATAVGLEVPELALPLGLLAGAVGFSRVYTGVHYPGDVLAGGLLGAAVALAAARLAPLHRPAGSRPLPPRAVSLPARQRGEGVIAVVNPNSGGGTGKKIIDLLQRELPEAEVVTLSPDDDLVEALRDAAERADVLAVGGGDGSVNAAAQIAIDADLPLLVLPAGTFNHFATDLGFEHVGAAVAAVRDATAIRIDVGTVNDGTDQASLFLNTASLGRYPDFVAVRERYESRLGKPAAAALAAARVLREPPLRALVEGREHLLAMLFIGSGKYEPAGFAPRWRPRLDDGRLDVRFLEAGHRLAWLRLTLSLFTGRLGRSRLYVEDDPVDLEIQLPDDGEHRLARDGEVSEGPSRLRFAKRHRALTVYCSLAAAGQSGPGLRLEAADTLRGHVGPR